MSKEAAMKTSARIRNFGLRAYLAGSGATAALIGAAVLVFGSLGAYVAFEGLPIGGDDAAVGEVAVNQGERPPGGSTGSGDEPRRADGGAARGAPDARADGGLADPPGSPLAGESATAPAQPLAGSNAVAVSPGPLEQFSGANPATAGGQAGNGPSVGGAVDETDGTADQITEVPFDELTDGVSQPLDDALDDAGGGASGGRVGGLLDDEQLDSH